MMTVDGHRLLAVVERRLGVEREARVRLRRSNGGEDLTHCLVRRIGRLEVSRRSFRTPPVSTGRERDGHVDGASHSRAEASAPSKRASSNSSIATGTVKTAQAKVATDDYTGARAESLHLRLIGVCVRLLSASQATLARSSRPLRGLETV